MSHKNGASDFAGEWIEFGPDYGITWENVLHYLLQPSQYASKSLDHNSINYLMVERTIKFLDAHSKVLNEQYKDNCTKEQYKEIAQLASLTNKWLKASGEEDESEYYDF